ncbi:dienelactone hydrolase family protein [Mesorhizobium sp. M1A.F.Ca.IN.022.07.1.1]|uniref:dienelactone hydrolase family protein n=2 Tax=Mesorhizobium TaxID=68287 RepID=UPI000FCC383E|nr:MULTISPECIES: dienelactone hydrolase family protein [unclassified Mesorhizobium]TGV93260.1 dienelactone hydrolase family protein [Mesorhizobium sp. M00.F.Ca.ET.158.01.1.1]RUV90106.1 dienelactone hydrolase family protein [Mesorhizobium sp. M1A.F.Ca.IN.022.07.1.1]RWG30356.1 MAG: dienelactone hydrolase family protein [Mesorhizobium sp.]TGQ21930.1 dienelactone hydrolase family protein [Mesorhizobium sp. M00.F.Ca.ET.217.01.1.1]TIN19619.1 MAG: dienelactone hydrolase family protein [Mesorhizobium 
MAEPVAKPVVTQPIITQAMIDAYDEYTHLTLDRRRFMEHLTRLAGSGAAAAAIAPMLAANSAKAAIVAENDPRVKGEDITYPGSSGEMKGYLVKPANQSGKLGTVIVVHENRGLNGHIRDVARRVALEGFVALAPDFLSPLGGTPADEDKARDMFSKLDAAQVAADGVATVAYLKTYQDSNGKVGAVGFCWGGGTVNTLAVNAPDLSAGVAYYGMQPKAEDVPKIKAALLLHYAGLDERINAGIDAYKKALDAAHVEYTVYVYDGVNHAFNNDTSAARYDKKAADLAWGRTVAFLKEKLA